MPEIAKEVLASISTPDRVETRLGTLEFVDGAPTAATAAVVFDHLDFMHGVEAFINSFPGASLAAVGNATARTVALDPREQEG